MRNLFLSLMICISISSNAAPDEVFSSSPLVHHKKKTSKIDKTKILIGPGLGFGAGNRAYSINVSPSLAYCITDKFHVGATLGINYYHEAMDYTNVLYYNKETYKYSLAEYTFSVFARYIVLNNLILNVEPELNNTKFILNPPPLTAADFDNSGKYKERSTRRTLGSFLIGGGYIQRFGDYSYSYIMANYDVVQNPNARRYYQTIDIRVGVMIALNK